MSDDSQDRLEEAMAEALQSVLRREEDVSPKDENSPSAQEPSTAEDGPAIRKTAPTNAAEAPAQPILSEEASELKEQLIRLAADFENFRKRARRDQQEARQFGIEKLLGDLLPALDNLDRALSHSGETSNPVIEGVVMVSKQFQDILNSYGVSCFDSLHEPFDPEKHDAIGQIPTSDVSTGCIAEEIQKGYFLHERLIRPAKVIVAIPPVAADKDEVEGETEPDAKNEENSP